MSAFSPIETGFSDPPKPYPLGFPLKDKVTIDPIRGSRANLIHKAHHSYVNEPRNGVVNHGIFLRGELVGAITYDYMLASHSIRGYESDEYIEVARVTVASDTPNLASCSMSKSQDRFSSEYAEENNIGMLVTYVREGWEGTMFKALRGKGWEFDGVSKGHQAGNRPERDIRDYDKDRWVCEI